MPSITLPVFPFINSPGKILVFMIPTTYFLECLAFLGENILTEDQYKGSFMSRGAKYSLGMFPRRVSVLVLDSVLQTHLTLLSLNNMPQCSCFLANVIVSYINQDLSNISINKCTNLCSFYIVYHLYLFLLEKSITVTCLTKLH